MSSCAGAWRAVGCYDGTRRRRWSGPARIFGERVAAPGREMRAQQASKQIELETRGRGTMRSGRNRWQLKRTGQIGFLGERLTVLKYELVVLVSHRYAVVPVNGDCAYSLAARKTCCLSIIDCVHVNTTWKPWNSMSCGKGSYFRYRNAVGMLTWDSYLVTRLHFCP
jgi:hypothetical protein